MATKLNIRFDPDLLESISSEFDLRAPNKEALRHLVFTLDGDYDPAVMQVLNLATGVGKTYLMAAFIEYLRRQGVGNVVIITPGKTVQAKTVQNFTPGSPRYIAGSAVPPETVTPQDYSSWVARQNGPVQLQPSRETPMLAFIFNIQQLIAPKSVEGETQGSGQQAMRRKPRRFDENAGVLFDYLKGLDDLVVIADESHLYGVSAAAFHGALKELDPAATIGLTASVNKKTDHVIFEYPLYRAIQDRYVKAPVLAFRKTGYGADEASEEQQLRDAVQLRAIKQGYYDAYAESQHRPQVNAVMFVVCSDVNHANQVAGLLRTPEYFGRAEAVLQVDSKHEDETTLRLLNELDRSHSPVRAVVSVNKLKEGWDVKNIAVVVTLRAMASEVLTQQTMGRGLRLPFGRYTGVGQIDQLDIIAHQSFTELLTAENVLSQFGLEDAVDEPDKARVKEAIRAAVQHRTEPQGKQGTEPGSSPGDDRPSSEPSADNSDQFVGSASHLPSSEPSTQEAGTVPIPLPHPDGSHGSSELGVRAMRDGHPAPAETLAPAFPTIERNPAFPEVSYDFPVTTMSVEQPVIELSEISDEKISQSARRVTSTGDVLIRKEIIAALGKGLRAEDREIAEVDSLPIDEPDANTALVKLVLNIPLVPKTAHAHRYVEGFLVPRFMANVTFTGWTVKSLASAENELRALINSYIATALRGTREVPAIHPKPMPRPGYMLPLGEEVYDQIEKRSEFVPRRVYRGWFKSLFAEEYFDSYSGEYQLAHLLNTSPGIVWWHRLHPQDQAFVYYNAKDRYFPDFVALDTEGVHWIIEGKDERGRDDARVQAKRKAAEALVRHLIAKEEFAGQQWGYLIAYEQDTAKADSWEDLKTLAQPVSNVI